MHTLAIEKMTYGLDALARLDGKVLFVPYAAPGDTAEIEVTETKSDYLRGRVSKIVTPSDARRESPCPNFPACGGCHWLHLKPEHQRREKEAMLRWLVKPLNPGTVYPIEPLPTARYRNKMELKVAVAEDGTVTLGNYMYHTHDVVSIRGCQVQCAENMEAYEALSEFLNQSENRGMAGNIVEIMVRTLGPQQQMMVTLKATPDETTLNAWRGYHDAHQKLGRLEVAAPDAVYLTLMREQQPFTFMKRNWTVSPRSFFQNNLEGAEAIFYTLISIYEATQQRGKFLDLYCGVGIQTVLLESRFDEVVGVECNEDSYQDALKNQKVRNPSRSRFYCKKVESIFGSPLTKGSLAAIHLNPPRTGLSQRVMRGLMGVKPRMMSYLSCNPMTFKRDAQAIMQMGYQLEQVYAFDLFPGTFHLEILGVFSR
ncbi:class I SAM-dependent RNA methyltransferase [Candidatus Ozemobacteraceae bacterium]|nr:class I SAM-dependent RNA methyltransferase [Candidatus Ozemobacteraceae bacterium]